MAIVGGGNIFIFEDDRGFNYRGAWNNTDTYAANDMVYHGSPAVAYLAFTSIAANNPPPGSTGWARLGARGTDGTAGPAGREGNYTVWLFTRSANEPRQPNASDIVYPASTSLSTTIWTLDISTLTGSNPLWISWVRADTASDSLTYGEVARLSGPQGPEGQTGSDGNSIQARYSPDGSSSWQATPRATDKYVQFSTDNGVTWLPSGGIKFVGDDGAQGMDGTQGADGTSVMIRFSERSGGPWNSTARTTDQYIQFSKDGGTTWEPTNGIKFVGNDGDDGDDSLEVQYASTNSDSFFHNTLAPNDIYIRFRVGNTGAWSRGVRFVGMQGADGESVEFEFSADMNRWEATARSGDKYIRFRSGSTGPWSNPIKFVGDDGTSGGIGPQGESISIEFSIDGQAGWHSNLQVADYFVRFQVGTRGWQAGVQFRAYPLMIQYSIDGSTLWHATFAAGADKYIRFSNDNGTTWTAGDRFVGEDGNDGADQLMLQYSTDNSTWHSTLAVADLYIRFSTDGGTTWSTGVLFARTGGFEITLYQRTGTRPTSTPLNLEYNWDTNAYSSLAGWSLDVPNTADQLWEIRVFIPARSASNIVRGTVRGSVYSNKGDTGNDGTDGTDGADGKFFRPIYQWSVNRPSDPTGLAYNVGNGVITGTGSWREAPATNGTGNEVLWEALIEISGTTANYITTYRSSGPQGPAGADGTDGTDGTDGGTGPAGDDGNSVSVIYQRNSTDPTQPSNGTGTWNGSDYDPPSGWHESVPNGTDPVYLVVVRLSGTDQTNSGITYDPVIKATGEDGQDAPGIGDNVDRVEFRFVTDTSDQVLESPSPDGVTTFDRVYHDVKAFTGGTTGLATQDATGITIPVAGIYSFVVQMDVRVLAASPNTYPDSEWGVILHIEDAQGTAIEHFAGNAMVNDGTIADNFTVPINRAIPPIQLPANSKVYLRIFYQRIQPGSVNSQPNQRFVFRVIDVSGMDDRLVVRRYTTTTRTSQGGVVGHDGNSLDVIYRRSSTILTTPPTGGVAQSGRLISAPTDWSTTVPNGSDPIYVCLAHINGTTNSIAYDEPVEWTGPQGSQGIQGIQGIQGNAGNDGTDGVKGDSYRPIYLRKATAPVSPQGITNNASGTFTNLVSTQSSPNNDTWHIDPPAGANQLYIQDLEIDWTGPTISIIGDPYRAQGERGPAGADGTDGTDGTDGSQGPAGAGGHGYAYFFLRTATHTPPQPQAITWNGVAFGNFGMWAQNNTNAGSGNYLWVTVVHYQLGVNGQTVLNPIEFRGVPGVDGTNAPDVQIQYSLDNTTFAASVANPVYIRFSVDGGTTWSAGQRFRGADGGQGIQGIQGIQGNPGNDGTDGSDGANGYGFIYYYHANTANSVSTPNVDYNGTAFTNVTSGWTTTIPTTPAGANVFLAPVRYQVGTSGETIDGVVRFGTVPGSVAPPPAQTPRTYTLYYGLVDGGTEVAASRQSTTFTLNPGDTYTQPNLIAFPTSTTATQDYFLRFDPTTDLNASSLTVLTQFGNISSRVTGTLATRFVIPLHAMGLQGHYRISIRRNA